MAAVVVCAVAVSSANETGPDRHPPPQPNFQQQPAQLPSTPSDHHYPQQQQEAPPIGAGYAHRELRNTPTPTTTTAQGGLASPRRDGRLVRGTNTNSPPALWQPTNARAAPDLDHDDDDEEEGEQPVPGTNTTAAAAGNATLLAGNATQPQRVRHMISVVDGRRIYGNADLMLHEKIRELRALKAKQQQQQQQQGTVPAPDQDVVAQHP